MGPSALFDKSFLQSLSVDESVWFDHFFSPTICPIFYVETLADLSKPKSSSGRSGEDEVRIIADKTPEMSGAPCTHHRVMCIGDLMGDHVPLTGQIPMTGGVPTRAPDGKQGIVFNASPESKAFSRWQHGDFQEIENQMAREWRRMLTNLDLPQTARNIRDVGINAQTCKSVEQAVEMARRIVRSNSKPFEQVQLLQNFVDIHPQEVRTIFDRWRDAQHKPLIAHAPYAAHVLTVELFFQIALGANLISAERPSNRIDISYLFYLPFCNFFVSNDKLHRLCAPPFLRTNQQFVWGPDLKADLARLNTEFAKLPEAVRDTGIMKFASVPLGGDDNLICQLFNRHFPGWRNREEKPIALSPEAEKKLVERLKKTMDEAAISASGGRPSEAEIENLSIQRMVRKRKGSWFQVDKNMKNQDEMPNRDN